MKVIIKQLTALLFSVVIFSFSFSSAFAETSKSISDESIANIKSNLVKMGVNKETQDKLIEKLLNGEAWDSMNPDKINTGETKKFYKVYSGNKVLIAKTTFPDGSVSQTTITFNDIVNKNGKINPMGGSSCGSGYCTYYGLKVEGGNGVVDASFYADYTLVTGGYDYINDVYQPQVRAQIGTIEDINGPTILRKYETQSQSARAYLQWTYKPYHTGIATQYLNFDVQNDSVSSYFTTNNN